MALKWSSYTLATSRVGGRREVGTRQELRICSWEVGFLVSFAIARAPSKTLAWGLRGSLGGTGRGPPGKDSNVNISVRSEAALPRLTPCQEGDRSASRGPWSIFSCPSWETLDNPGIPGLEVWLPFLGLVPWALPPLPRCHTSPHLSSHPTSPQP